MRLMTGSERAFARAVTKLAYCNPFLPERIDFEREVLGPDFVRAGAVVNQKNRGLPAVSVA